MLERTPAGKDALVIVGLGLLVSSLIGCAEQQVDSAKERWVNQVPCSAPCWEGIEPGKTLPDDVITLLTDSDLVDSYGEGPGRLGRVTVIEWTTKDDGSSWNGIIAYSDKEIPITTILINTPDLCLAEIISVYGEPSYLLKFAYDVIKFVDLVWPESGLAYSAKDESPANGITGDICGGAIIQFPVGTTLTDIQGFGSTSFDQEDFVPWRGYGDY